MPAATPLPLRQAIQQRLQQGQSAAHIARSLRLPESTVRELVRRWRTQPEALAPRYTRGGRRRTAEREQQRDTVLALRREHPTWGAGLLRVHLPTGPQTPWPGERTISRWLDEAGLAPAPPGRRAGVRRRRAEQPHAVWQMDASEHIALATTQRVSWLRITDEHSGAVLATTVFSPRRVDDRPRGGDAGSLTRRFWSLGFTRLPARG